MDPAEAPSGARDRASYLWGAAVVWATIWLATAVVLEGGGDFADMIPVLVVGTGWFLAVVPAQMGRSGGRRSGRA